MRRADVDGVFAASRIAFPDHFEARERFAEKFALFPQGCFVLENGAVVGGYLIAYPWPAGQIPPLDAQLGSVPASLETLFLHDLVILPECRGQGLARPIVTRLIEERAAEGARQIALVSVNGTVAFWAGLGFAPVTGDAALAAKLASYGAGAAYMTRRIVRLSPSVGDL